MNRLRQPSAVSSQRSAVAPHSALRTPHSPLRTGFTLVEMLVTITILLIVMGITMTAVNLTLSGDRVRSTARNVQSYLLGARDRAIFSKAPRGVRFIFDQDELANNGNSVVRSMVYIGPLDPATGTLDVVADGVTLRQTPGSGTPWGTLALRGLLVPGARIRVPTTPSVPADNGLWYVVANIDATNNIITISTPHADLEGTGSSAPVNYELELTPGVLPNQEPTVFPRGIVIDLDPASSRLPALWTAYPDRMDVMFSPRGTLTGPIASAGVIHLLVADVVDVELNRPAGDPTKEGDEIVVTIFTRTGQVSNHAVDTASGNPYRYAETGEAAP
ncbi:MAG: prepilin-type N-terminal cleavage/methylation domain-containing protein [Planctomycetales bacterium]